MPNGEDAIPGAPPWTLGSVAKMPHFYS